MNFIFHLYGTFFIRYIEDITWPCGDTNFSIVGNIQCCWKKRPVTPSELGNNKGDKRNTNTKTPVECKNCISHRDLTIQNAFSENLKKNSIFQQVQLYMYAQVYVCIWTLRSWWLHVRNFIITGRHFHTNFKEPKSWTWVICKNGVNKRTFIEMLFFFYRNALFSLFCKGFKSFFFVFCSEWSKKREREKERLKDNKNSLRQFVTKTSHYKL